MADRIRITCSNCSVQLVVPGDSAGKFVNCQRCGTQFQIQSNQTSTGTPTRNSVPAPSKASPPVIRRQAKKIPLRSNQPQVPAEREWDEGYADAESILGTTKPRSPPRQRSRPVESDTVAPPQYSRNQGNEHNDQRYDQSLRQELQRGARFVRFSYAISIVRFTWQCQSKPYLIRPGQSAALKAMPYTIMALLFGWWGIPFGPIYTVAAIVSNLQGGIDVTDEVVG